MYITRRWCAWDIRGNFLKVGPIESRDYATWKFAVNPYERHEDFTLPILARARLTGYRIQINLRVRLRSQGSRSLAIYVIYTHAPVRNRVWVNKSWLLDRRQGNRMLWDENVPQASSLSLSKQLRRRRKIANSSLTTIIYSGDPTTCYISCIFIFRSIYFLLIRKKSFWTSIFFHNFLTFDKYR